jgi:hypothetical protein
MNDLELRSELVKYKALVAAHPLAGVMGRKFSGCEQDFLHSDTPTRSVHLAVLRNPIVKPLLEFPME